MGLPHPCAFTENLFLDEPTIGLDAVSKLAVRDFILNLNAKHKTTVILTTHDMQDIAALAQRVILIGKGRILLDGTLEDMRQLATGSDITTTHYPMQITHLKITKAKA